MSRDTRRPFHFTRSNVFNLSEVTLLSRSCSVSRAYSRNTEPNITNSHIPRRITYAPQYFIRECVNELSVTIRDTSPRLRPHADSHLWISLWSVGFLCTENAVRLSSVQRPLYSSECLYNPVSTRKKEDYKIRKGCSPVAETSTCQCGYC